MRQVSSINIITSSTRTHTNIYVEMPTNETSKQNDGFSWSAHTRIRGYMPSSDQFSMGKMAKGKPSLRKVQILNGKRRKGKKSAKQTWRNRFYEMPWKNFVILSDILQWISNLLTTLSASILGKNCALAPRERKQKKKKKKIMSNILKMHEFDER